VNYYKKINTQFNLHFCAFNLFYQTRT